MKIPKNKQEKFSTHYSEFSNSTRAYLCANPKASYDTARTEGAKYFAEPCIKKLIQQKQDLFNEKYLHSKEKTISELLITAEEAKANGRYSDYAKLRDMVIKMNGFYEPEKLEIEGTQTVIITVANANKEDLEKI